MSKQSLQKPLRNLIRRAERGEDSSFEFSTMVIPMMLMIGLIAFATLVRSSQVPAWTAASECSRAAIATLNKDIGETQGRRAAINSLNGNFIRATGATVSVNYGTWDRGTEVTCRVNYSIDVSGINMLDGLVPGNKIPMNAEVTLRIEKYKSRWAS